MNKLRRIILSKGAVRQFITTGSINIKIINGLPKDAEVIGFDKNVQTGCLEVIVAHDSFEPVPEGNVIPTMTVEYKIL